MFRKMKIGTRLVLGFSMLVLFVTCLSSFAIYTSHVSSKLQMEVTRLKDNEVLGQRIVKRVYEGRLHVAMGLISGQSIRWEKFEAAFARAHSRLDQLIGQTTDPVQLGKVKEIERLLNDYAGKTETLHGMNSAKKALETPEGSRLIEDMTLIGVRIDELGNEVTDHYETAAIDMTLQADGQINRMAHIAIGFGIISVLLGIALSVVITRSVSRPVRAMSRAMGSLAAGDLSVDLSLPTGHDEIEEMVKAVRVFKETAIRSEDYLREEETAKKQGRAPLRWMKG